MLYLKGGIFFLLFTILWNTKSKLIRSVLFVMLDVFTFDQNCLACNAHSGQGKLLQIWIKIKINCGPIRGKLESFIFSARVCINNQVGGPQVLGDII
jgi:hypothetical protein